MYPYEVMKAIIRRARTIAVAYCPCRVTAQLLGKALCDHPLEVCLKYDELAEYLIEGGIGRQIGVDEAVCIGCGLCALPYPSDALRLKRHTGVAQPAAFGELHGRILEEKRL